MITEVSPQLGPTEGGIDVHVRGTGFAPDTAVRIGGLPAPLREFVSPSEVVVTLPVWTGEPTPVTVVVDDTAGHHALYGERFTYYALGYNTDPRSGPERLTTALALADLDGDGFRDIAIAQEEPAAVLVFASDGALGFHFQRAVPLDFAPSALAAADFSGDGVADLAVADAARGQVTLILTRSSGPPIVPPSASAGCPAASLTAVELGGDARPDLVVGCRDGSDSIYVLINQYGAAGVPGPLGVPFATPRPFDQGPGPLAVASADLNQDRRMDLITISRTGALGVVLRGAGDALMALPFRMAVRAPSAVVAADVNQDGKLDVLAASSERAQLLTLIGDGTGVFGEPQVSEVAAPALSLGNLAGGRATTLLLSTSASGAQLLVPQPTGLVRADATVNGAALSPISATGDLDNDTMPELVVALAQGRGVAIVKSSASSLTITSQPLLAAPPAQWVAELSGDAFFDAAWIDGVSGTVEVAIADGQRLLKPKTSYAVSQGARALASGDINGDSLPDLLVGHAAALSVLIGRGQAMFQPAFELPLPGGAAQLLIYDASGDGKPDAVALPAAASSELLFLAGKGNGSFAAGASIPIGAPVRRLTSSDLDDDGRRDLVVITERDLRLVRGAGEASFAEAVVIDTCRDGQAMTTADFNQDGIRDVLVGSAVDKTLRIYIGKKGGTPEKWQELTVTEVPRSLVALDANRDGSVDVAMVSGDSRWVYVHLGRPDGKLLPAIRFDAGFLISAVGALDLEGDAWRDLFALGSDGYTLLHNRALH